MNNKTAILMTCFNRKKHTVDCLNRLYSLKTSIDIYLVDDNSSDGTSEAIKELYPLVKLIQGTGELFWNRGMHLAWSEAAKFNYDYFVWLNDDVLLFPNCFEELYECARITNNEAIIGGIIIDKFYNNKVIYGGFDENKELIYPNGQLNPITHLNGNVVLVPNKVFTKLGNLDSNFIHDFGDVDYGLNAIKNNIKVLTTRVAIAAGELNVFCRVRLNNVNVVKRFKKLYSPLGSNPFKQFYFIRKHHGPIKALFYFGFLHFLNLIPDRVNKLLFKNKYI